MTYTAHRDTASALATKAQNFLKVAGLIYSFTDEEECWRVHQHENIQAGSGEPSGRAKHFFRWQLAA